MQELPLDIIDKLLKEPQPTKRSRGPKVDPTTQRDLTTWMKLAHHLCLSTCEHRQSSPTNRACWNPNCVDPRPLTDRGTQVVFMVKDHMMCRYCYLDGWLA